MRRHHLAIIGLLLTGASTLAAQSSQFGVRGLGLPVRPLSPRAVATGGAFGMFDLESSQNPASIAGVLQFTSLLTSAQNFRTSTNPYGTATARDNRYPQIMVTGPVGGTRVSASVSMSGYTDRNFSLGTADTIQLRGAPVGVFDTLSSRGGLSDLRVAGAWQISKSVSFGVGLHAITGSNRIDNRRHFADSTYAVAVEQSQLSYLGLGISTGITIRVAPRLSIAGTYRNDGHLTIDRDSSRIARTDLPSSYGAAVRWQPSMKVAWAASYQAKQWSSSSRDIVAQGGVGADNVYEVATGFEFLRDSKNPSQKPFRIGGHYATLPFPIRAGSQPHEVGIAVGTGLRFVGGRGGFDVALERNWRSDGTGYKEHATVFTFGISIRP